MHFWNQANKILIRPCAPIKNSPRRSWRYCTFRKHSQNALKCTLIFLDEIDGHKGTQRSKLSSLIKLIYDQNNYTDWHC